MMKLHLATVKHRDGGTITHTLCHRDNAKSLDGYNSTGEPAEVTCGHCLRIMAQPWYKRRQAQLETAE